MSEKKHTSSISLFVKLEISQCNEPTEPLNAMNRLNLAMQLINSIARQTDTGEEIYALVLRVAKKGRQPYAQTLVNTFHACVANDSQNIPLELFPLIGILLTSPLFMAVGYMLLIPLGFCVNYIRDPVKHLSAEMRMLNLFSPFVIKR